MNRTLLLIVVGVLVALIVLCIGSYISANNHGATMDARLKAKYTDMENVLATGAKKVQEVVQVPDMYRDDFEKIVKADMQGRYGAGGSKAAFQWLKERNLNYDSAVYTKVQQVIAGFRNKFENAQSSMIGVKQLYETDVDSAWLGFWLRMAGKPKVALSEYQIISSDFAQKAFEDHKENGLKLR